MARREGLKKAFGELPHEAPRAPSFIAALLPNSTLPLAARLGLRTQIDHVTARTRHIAATAAKLPVTEAKPARRSLHGFTAGFRRNMESHARHAACQKSIERNAKIAGIA